MPEDPAPAAPASPARSGITPAPWLLGVVGALLVAVGLFLVTRPLSSVAALGLAVGAGFIAAAVAEAVGAFRLAGRASRWLHLGWALILAVIGIGVLVLPRLTVAAVAWLLGVVLILSGLRDLLRALRSAEARAANLLGGLAAVLYGVLALTWRDVTLLALGVLFGAWLIVSGARLLIGVLRGRRGPARGERRRPGWLRIAVSALSLAVAIVLAVFGARLTGTTSPDAFYDVPAEAASLAPGTLLRAEPFTRTIPADATAWRILYTTTRDEGEPAVASGLVVVPDGVDAPPVIAWAHGTTGIAAGCAPSLLPEPFVGGAMPNTDRALEAGWAIVATDYLGLGADAPHAYLVGEAAARSVLDAVRAAGQLPDASLGEQVVVWGHSQGGGAALWTGQLAPGYAPELDVVGVAAMAPAANLPRMIDSLADGPAGTIVGPLVLQGFAGHYDDVRVRDYLMPQAQLLFDETVQRCWSDPSILVSALAAGVLERPIWSQDPNDGALGQRLAENVPRGPIPAPLLIAQGLADTLVLPEAQQEYVDALCEAGQQLDYRGYPGKDHMGVVTGDSPLLDELMEWTRLRLAGAAPLDTCG